MRRDHRQRVLKGATVLLGMTKSEIACTIRNMHHNGAELRLPPDAQVPNEFLLYVRADSIAYKAVVRWRDGPHLGVMFIGTAEKPHWHYG